VVNTRPVRVGWIGKGVMVLVDLDNGRGDQAEKHPTISYGPWICGESPADDSSRLPRELRSPSSGYAVRALQGSRHTVPSKRSLGGIATVRGRTTPRRRSQGNWGRVEAVVGRKKRPTDKPPNAFP
jgi:hypothetical protein